MFHVLEGTELKNHESVALCGLKYFRSGIGEQKFAELNGQGKLNSNRLCKRCASLVGRVKPKRKKKGKRKENRVDNNRT